MLVFAQALRHMIEQQISIVARGEFQSLVGCATESRRFHDIDTGGFHALFSEDAPLSAELCESMKNVELVVNMLPDPEEIVARRLRSLRVRRVVDIDTRARDALNGHIVEQWIGDYCRATGLSHEHGTQFERILASTTPTIHLPDEAIRAGREILDTTRGMRGSRPSLLIHPGSGSRSKNWPIERFVALAEAWQTAGRRIAFLIGPVEREQLAADILSELEQCAPLVGSTDLRVIAGCLVASDCVIANDSGIAHLTAAVGGQVVTIFGPTHPVRWRPVGPRVTVLNHAGGWPTVEQVLSAATTRAVSQA